MPKRTSADLILWRHAEAEDWREGLPEASTELDRALTPRGEKQAERMAVWLNRQLPEGTRVWVSPARRCEQTALALGRKFTLCQALAPDASCQALLALVQWPLAQQPMLVIGHQPTLGRTIAQLMGLVQGDCPVKKGAVWWLRCRERNASVQTVVVTVQSPEVL